MTIKQKLFALCAGLLTLMAMMGGMSVLGLAKTNSAFETTYNDRILPLGQLKKVSDMYAVNIVDATHKVNYQLLAPPEALSQIKQALSLIDQQWKAYTATQLTSEEATIVAETQKTMDLANREVLTLEQLLAKGE